MVLFQVAFCKCLSVLQVTTMVSDKTQRFTWGIQMANPVGRLWRHPHLIGSGEELCCVNRERLKYAPLFSASASILESFAQIDNADFYVIIINYFFQCFIILFNI